MAVRRGVSRATWQQRQGEMCPKGLVFAQRFDTAGAAWRACTQGDFMAWWLHQFYGVNTDILQRLLPEHMRNDPSINICWCFKNTTFKYAEVLRAHYNVDGTTRKR